MAKRCFSDYPEIIQELLLKYSKKYLKQIYFLEHDYIVHLQFCSLRQLFKAKGIEKSF